MYINLTKKEITFIYEYLLIMNNNESIIYTQQKKIILNLLIKLRVIIKENEDT